MRLPSFSKLTRVEKCPASHAMPQSSTTGDAAERGTGGHKVFELIPSIGIEAALAQAPDDVRAICRAVDLTELPLDGRKYRAEVSVAIDVETGAARELGADDKPTDSEVAGRIDVTGDTGAAAYVGDWKFGQGARGYVSRAAESLQLHAGGYAMARIYGRDAAEVENIQIKEDGRVYRDGHALDEFDLAATLKRLRGIAERVRGTKRAIERGEVPTTAEGPWCAFCPAFQFCPAKKSLALAVAGAAKELLPVVDAALTPQLAAEAWRRIEALESVTKAVKARLYAMAATTPIDLGDGRVLGATQTRRETLDGRVVFDVLRGRFGDEVAKAAVELESSKAAVRRALAMVAKRGELAGMEREALAALREVGGVNVESKETVKIYEPGEADAEVA